MADPIQIAAPDGSTVEFPAGTPDSTIKVVMAKNYPPTGDASKLDPELAAAAASDAHPDDAGAMHYIRSALQAADPYVRSAANALTLGLADRFAAGAGAATGIGGNAGDYAGNLKTEQDKTDQFATAHPYVNAGIQAGGALATLPFLPEAAALKTASLGTKALAGAGAGAVVGGVGGAISSRDLTDLPQTIKDAAFGAGGGALLGAGVPIVGKGIGTGLNWLVDALRSTPGISRGAAKSLLPAIQADGAGAVGANLDQLGPDAMLADAGPALQGKAQGAVLNSDDAKSILNTKLKARNKDTDARIQSDVNAALGPADAMNSHDPQTVTNDILAHRTATDNVNYPAALDNAPDVQTAPILQALTAQIPRTVGMERKALTNLRDMMMTTEQRPRLDPFGRQEVNPTSGQPIFDETPVSQNDAGVLHRVKQELDNVINYDAPGLGVPAGALKNQQGSLKFFRGSLNGALENQVPGYREANATSSALAKRAEAVQAGTKYLGSGKTTPSPGRFADEFNPLSQGEKIAFAKGSRGDIERVLGTKANDLEALRGELQGEGGWNTAKIATVHGQDAADQLMASVDRNRVFRDTYNKVVENSQTAQRTAAAKAMKPDPSSQTPLVNPNMTLPGMVATMAKKTAIGIANALLQKDPTKSYAEVAKILSAQGPEARVYLKALAQTLQRRAAQSPALNRAGDRASLAAMVAAGRYLNRPSLQPDQSTGR